MPAYPDNQDHFSKTFCHVIGWLEAIQANSEAEDAVWIWEADDKTGKLSLIGDSENCVAFQSAAAMIIQRTPDPDELWRYY